MDSEYKYKIKFGCKDIIEGFPEGFAGIKDPIIGKGYNSCLGKLFIFIGQNISREVSFSFKWPAEDVSYMSNNEKDFKKVKSLFDSIRESKEFSNLLLKLYDGSIHLGSQTSDDIDAIIKNHYIKVSYEHLNENLSDKAEDVNKKTKI